MKNNLRKFENDVFRDLNTVVINEEIWLNANDVVVPWDIVIPVMLWQDMLMGTMS